MKTYMSYLVIALLMTHTLTAQVKIGDNPQTLNPSSILELESTSSVLVITRVTDVQMNAITPLRGALVYNTDQNCLHYYNGDEWINICKSLDNSFTVSTLAEHMRPINPNALDDTVVITETPNPDGSINYNFEVGILNGANIAPSAINGDKIQNGTVGSQDLAPRSVGLSHLQDGGANGDLFQWNGSAWTLINEADISITESQDLADVIAVDPSAGNQQIKDLQNPTDLQDAATMGYVDDSIATSDALDLDKDETNELQDLNLTSNILTLSNPATPGNQVNLAGYLDNTDNQNLSIGGGGTPNQTVEVAISGGTSAIVDVRDGDFDPNNENQTVSAGTGISVNQTGQDFQVTNSAPDLTVALADGGSGNVTIGGTYPNFTIDVPDNTDSQNLSIGGGGTPNQTVEVAISGGTSAIVDVRDGDFDPNNENQTVSAGTGISVNQTGQDFQVTNSAPDLTVALTDGGSGNVTIGGIYPNFTIDVPDNTDSQNLSIGGGGTPNQTVEVAISGGTSAIVDVRDGDFDPTNEIQNVIAGGPGISVSQAGLDFFVENTAPDQVVSLTDGGSGNVIIGGGYPNFTIDVADITTGDITSSDLNVSGGADATLNNVTLEINPGAVGNLELAINAVTTDKIQDGTITNDDIQLGAGIDGSKINPAFVSDVSTTGDFVSGGTILDVPDFVFQKYYTGFSNLNNSYQFRSLKEIEAFVKENNHLPGIKSAYEVKSSGEYRLAESSLAHLEKIEELFLHTIEQEKKIEKLQSENEKMAEELHALKSDMEKIKAMLSEKNQD
ncbi:bZIP transcription factor [Flagellimonas amoyensis]|uniref:bZIP transcription factor n=1 Tax=Flagellimonas amoyensis TaxID=2169401 RepID=UPI00131F1227|nr:bZIP transcription factor [Allomuricauda amoyensis]